ncbi:MAG: tetratricopeptide repeat protein [Proteobacteria bacterium]|nr:tetratricopeptide repeat protein [Pseudomonadota bacterium]
MGRKQKLKAERKAQQQTDGVKKTRMPALSGGAKLVLLIAVAGLAATLIWSVGYRAEHPSMTVKPRATQADDHGDENPMANMGMITELMKKLEDNPKDVHTLHTLGEQFMRMQAWDRAEALLSRALVVEPGNLQVLNLLGITEFNLKRFEDAAGKFEMILELEPGNVMASYNLGIIYGHFLDDKVKAAEYLQSILDTPGVDDDTREQAEEALKELDH